MNPLNISLADQELLEDFRRALLENKLTVGAEFEQDMRHYGLGEDRALADFFSGLLMGEGEALVKERFGRAGGPVSHQIISLFDSYLACIARRAASVFTDAVTTRRTLEALRRVAFHYMSVAVHSHVAASMMPQDEELFDPNTGMLNQEGFLAAIDYLVEDEANLTFAVIMLELDFGMSVTDAAGFLQQEVAQRLLHVAREGDLVARLSPQRWALGLCRLESVAQAELAAQKLRRQFEESFIVLDRSVSPAIRIGVALSPDHGSSGESLQRAAFKAARWSAHNDENIQYYSPTIDLENSRNRNLGDMLRKALFENALTLHYQPQFSLSGNRVVGLEALLRWESPEGRIPPPIMLELVEREGLVPQLTQWLINTAFRHFAVFRREGIDTTLSINLLSQNFCQEEFPEMLAQAADVWKVPADKIVLEITENSIFDDIDGTIRQIRQLKEIGVNISLDGFGTGYSSMSYLSKLEIDELKIDQSFIQAMPTSTRDMAIVRAIANLAANFNLTLVAVGVETVEAATSLKELGCDVIQGYWISKPLSPDMLTRWWKARGQPPA
jgi:EAL domain-containing protein (putative c-di-GMP-specific phosphodiesterase class I)/GGDEF domain-containing protein